MRRTTVYCLIGCCATFVAIGLVMTSSEKPDQGSEISKAEIAPKRSSVRPTSLVFDSRYGPPSSGQVISFQSEQERTNMEREDVCNSLETAAPVATELQEEISRLSNQRVEGAENLPSLLEKALSTPNDSSDDLEFMAAYHRVRTAAPVGAQEN